MFQKVTFLGTVLGFSFLLGSFASQEFLIDVNSGQVLAQMTHQKMQPSDTEPKNQIQRIEQPLWVKGAVTAGGLSLIGLELWWFLWKTQR